MLSTLSTLLLTILALTSALPTQPLFPRQTSNYTIIGTLLARDTANNYYDIAGAVPNPANPYGVQPIVGLSPYIPAGPNNRYKLTYSVQGAGTVRAGSPFGGQLFWIVNGTGEESGLQTGFLNTTSDASGAGATPGFVFNATGDNMLRFMGEGFGGFYGCTGLQVNGNLVLEMEFGGLVPSDGDCKELTLGKFTVPAWRVGRVDGMGEDGAGK